MAGERAIASYAYEQALFHFERALTDREGFFSSTDVGQGVDAETATILFGLGRAQTAIFARAQAQEAVDTLRCAFDAFVDRGDTKNAVAVAVHPHGFLGFSSGSADMAARALDLVPPDSLEAGYLLLRYGAALSWENNDHEGAQENLDQAVEIARHEGDRILEVRALVYIAIILWDQEHYRQAVEMILPVIELAQSLDELDALVLARIMCTNCLLTMGDGYEAQIHATAGLAEAERLHSSNRLVQILGYNATLAILRGEWKGAQEFNNPALAESPRDVSALAIGALLNLQVGNLEESGEYIKRILEELPDVLVGAGLEHANAAVTIPLFARVTGTTELLDVAESAAREIFSKKLLPNISPPSVGLALIAIQRNDAESAREQYPFLDSRRGFQELAVICYDRLLGLLVQTTGDLDNAQAYFEDALAFCRKAGYRPELAWALCDYADMLLERKDEGDSKTAMVMLDESLSISTELGMRPLMERVLSRREILKA